LLITGKEFVVVLTVQFGEELCCQLYVRLVFFMQA